MNFGQVIEYNREIFFFKNYAENESGELVSELFLFFEKPIYEVKASYLNVNFNIFRYSSTLQTIKTNCVKL